MRRHRHREVDEGQIDLTPMLDVVFIMLIFFIVTATFVKESGVEIARPLAATAEQQDTAKIMVGIDAGNDIWINRQRVALAAVRPQVERLRVENPQSSAVIQADEAASTGVLVRVMDQVRLAGVENIAVAARSQP
ncbi:MAG: biopolymer transporter ExbD [Gammaproteobacteria bacterium]|nr:biopolymer transporter ExbD [Gammaproteobacteria bacterium]MBU1653703.1 biopolymer transporter ExbD [Gammaproteobacteria bacterium]MBU1962756.1 biopolymer transporter ExbD [Gammaproteobacteria bacterium]